jgi:uncharacterized protein
MSTEQGKVLLAIARAAIAREFGVSLSADESAPWLAEQGACFVTLTQRGALRGCIGSLQAHRSLLADVKSNALSAAFHDTRFMPLTRDELKITVIEVSLLSAVEPMRVRDEADALAQLRPGVDGIIFEYAHRRGTFLPQVWEELPLPREFLAHLKLKAGFPADFWAEGVKLSRYTATQFSEQKHSGGDHERHN